VLLNGQRIQQDAVAAARDAAIEVQAKAAAAHANETALADATNVAQARISMTMRAATDADLAKRKAGVQVPADEVVFVATGPVRVSELSIGIGDPILSSIMKVTNATVHVETGLTVADAGFVKPDMVVRIEEPDLGIDTEGIVTFVAPGPGTNGVDAFHVYTEIAVGKPPTNLVGASVRVTVTVDSSGSEVLTVPVSAVTLSADGTSRVERQTGASTEFVTVTPGLAAGGFVEIVPKKGKLAAGDLVVIGSTEATTPGATPASTPATTSAQPPVSVLAGG
jgi:hypothetical protein